MDVSESPHISPEDREFQLTPNTDTSGKDWVIFRSRGTGLYHVRPDPDRADAVIPELVVGQFTKVPLAQEAIDRYLVLDKEQAVLAIVKNTRVEEAAAEQKLLNIQAAVRAENEKAESAAKAEITEGAKERACPKPKAKPKSKSQSKRLKVQSAPTEDN